MSGPDLERAVRRPLVVAIDGPSGSGKSSVSRAVAARLGLAYLDTGAMYRAVCWSALEQGIDPADADAVADLARRLALTVGTEPHDARVAVGPLDVTEAIRTPRVTAVVSTVAAHPGVRAELRRRQREIIEAARLGEPRGCVAEGRDLTTVVAPDADVRILLTADAGARVARRALELHGTADETALEATRDQVVRRDAVDAGVTSFREAAPGVTALDSSALSFEETVRAVLDLVVAQAPAGAGTSGRAT